MKLERSESLPISSHLLEPESNLVPTVVYRAKVFQVAGFQWDRHISETLQEAAHTGGLQVSLVVQHGRTQELWCQVLEVIFINDQDFK